jgi:hypothetical protein
MIRFTAHLQLGNTSTVTIKAAQITIIHTLTATKSRCMFTVFQQGSFLKPLQLKNGRLKTVSSVQALIVLAQDLLSQADS